MRGVGSKLGVANMVGVSAYVRDTELEIPSLDYPQIPDSLKYSGQSAPLSLVEECRGSALIGPELP